MEKSPAKGNNNALGTRARIALIFLLVVLFAGLFRVSVNGDPSQLVASNSVRYQAYVARLENFPTEQNQLLVFTEADVLDAEHLRRYASVLEPLVALPQVAFVGSLFSAPVMANALRSIINDPDKSLESGIVDDVRALLSQRDFLPARMVSPNFDAAQMSIMLSSTESIEHTISAVESIMDAAYPADSGIRWSLAGNPMVEQAIKRDVVKELIRVTFIAIVFGALVAAFVIRHLRSVLVVLCLPTVAVIGTVGLMGWLGLALTLLSQAVLLVVFLVVFTDTLHALRGGRSQSSLLVACCLTSVTTGSAAIALWFADSVVIQDFAITLLVGIAVGFSVWVLWLFAFPRNEQNLRQSNGQTNGQTSRQKNWQGIKPWTLTPNEASFSKPRLIGGGISLCVLIFLGAQLRPGFSIAENLPRSHEIASALSLAEQQFSGYLPLQVVVAPIDDALSTETFVERLAQLQQAMNTAAVVEPSVEPSVDLRWFSLVDVLALVPGDTYEQRLSFLPPPLLSTLWREGNQAVLFAPESITHWLQTPHNAAQNLDNILQPLATELELQAGLVTGMPILVREASDALIGDAWRSVLLTVLVLGLAVWVFLKSFRLAGLAAVPVVFSLATYAAALFILGEPLRHAGVVMMTLVIGLSVDNALHLIVSAQNENNRKLLAIGDCLTVLNLATLSTIAGFIALAFSDIPSLGVLGLATSTALAVGFFASAIGLPPVLLNSKQVRE